MTSQELDQLAINTIRTLSIDAVQQAKSGHPGTPMALAPLVYTLWNRVMRFDPKDPQHPEADRFVLSKGHGAPILYSVWAELGLFPREHLLTLGELGPLRWPPALRSGTVRPIACSTRSGGSAHA